MRGRSVATAPRIVHSATIMMLCLRHHGLIELVEKFCNS